jgi:hypothetical protein
MNFTAAANAEAAAHAVIANVPIIVGDDGQPIVAETLRAAAVQMRLSHRCYACSTLHGVVKAGREGKIVYDVGDHVNSLKHARRMEQLRGPPPGVGVMQPNPVMYEPRVRCIACTLDPAGQPRLSQGASMTLATVDIHTGSPEHTRRVRDGRLAIYHAAHAGQPGRMAGEAW